MNSESKKQQRLDCFRYTFEVFLVQLPDALLSTHLRSVLLFWTLLTSSSSCWILRSTCMCCCCNTPSHSSSQRRVTLRSSLTNSCTWWTDGNATKPVWAEELVYTLIPIAWRVYSGVLFLSIFLVLPRAGQFGLKIKSRTFQTNGLFSI